MSKIQNYLQRFKQSWSNAQQWQSTLEDAYKYAVPQQVTYDNPISTGEKRGSDVYDSTLPSSLTGFVGKMASGLTPAGAQWLSLVPGPDVDDSFKEEVHRELQNVTDTFFKFIERSNFYPTIYSAYRDWAIGTAAILCNENDDDDNPLHFSCVPIDTIALEIGPFEKPDNPWRRYYNYPARNIEQQWVGANIDSYIRGRISQDYNYKVEIIEGTIWDPQEKLYNYIVMTKDGQHVFVDEYTESSPWIIFRYSNYRNEAFGRGIVLDLMPEVKTLNKMREDMLKQQELALNPPIIAMGDSIANMHNIRFEPNSIIPAQMMPDGSLSVQQLANRSNFQVSYNEMQYIRSVIQKALFSDPLGPIETPAKTATEITIRVREITERIAPAAGLFMWEFGNQFVDRVLYILKKRGIIPQIKVDGKEVSIRYASPLTNSHNLSEAANLEQYWAQLVQMLGPEAALAGVKVDELPSWLAEKHGVDLDIVNTQEEISQMRDNIMQQQSSSLVSEGSLPTEMLQNIQAINN